jgi:hypothetical protein
MPKPFDGASTHLIENRPQDWLALAGFPVPDSPEAISIVDVDLSNVMTTAADKLIRVDVWERCLWHRSPLERRVSCRTLGRWAADYRLRCPCNRAGSLCWLPRC